ncbi:MAG: peptide chain release factor N(5)-glutamine methyltransferase [Alphaproteobacteria bacterium]|nr:MAG: peptide chain release factor N(5)-glutamine methyltransferase [Alphaproteobacteria bacterium]
MGLANESGSPRGRTRSGHPRLRTSQSSAEQDVDARDKPGHGELGDQGLGGTVGEALDETAAALAAAGIDEPRRQARRIMVAALGLSPAEVFAHPHRRLDREEHARIQAMVRRVAAHEPLSRITGHREFWGRDFVLSRDTLDPRPETETVVEAVLARLTDREQPYRFLDLGTGSGCLLLALLSEYPQASGIGVDVAYGAAITARHNAARLGLGERASFVAGDWGAGLAGGFDAVVANPPYIATADLAALMPEVRDHDPRRALDGGADGLAAYRAIARDLPRLLVPGGLLAAEIGLGQADSVAEIIIAGGLAVERVAPDLAGIARVVLACRLG